MNNSQLGKLMPREARTDKRALSAFRICGYIGMGLANVLTIMLAARLEVSLWITAAIIPLAVFTFLGLAMITKIAVGEERLTCYHYHITVMAVVGVLLWMLRQPILLYLDMTILGVGMFLACGRVGCFMVGCCHGRPCQWGVRYREEHAEAGFTTYYVGVRLFPIQLVESLWVSGIVLVGSVFVLTHRPPGEVLAWYIIAYGAGRFCFEFMRGDGERPYLLGFSEAQWTSMALMCAVVWVGLLGALPFHIWYAIATIVVALTMIAVATTRLLRKTAKHKLLHPRYVSEFAEALEIVSSPVVLENTIADIPVACTSLGIQISAGRIRNVRGYICHYSLSCREGVMTEGTAEILAGMIRLLKRLSCPDQLIKGNGGVFHLLAEETMP